MADENNGKVSRWASRRFLLAVAGCIVSVLVILGKLAPEETEGAVQVIVGAATLVLNVLGYQVTEASVDRARAGNGKATEGGTQ
jgi:hypothetical protein